MEAKQLIKDEEQLRLVAYPDPGTKGEPWTIGYGHTGGVKKGDKCTKEQAEAWLDQDLSYAYSIVDKAVKVPLSRQQRDALCSFVFNVGHGRKNVKDGFVELKRGGPSTMLRKLNAGDYVGAAAQFPLWNKAAGKVLRGLVKRRGKERALFLSGTNIPEAALPIQEEKQMAPFIIPAAIELIKELPNFAKIFQNKDVSERNIEAIVKATDIVVEAVGATNLQDAVEKVKADPAMKEAANEAVKLNAADLLDAFERINAMDQGNIKAARDYNAAEPLMVNTKWVKLKFVHVLSLLFVGFSGAFVTMHWESLTPELKGAVITLMIIAGWNGVRDYWMGSSEGSARKTEMLTR